MGTVLGVSNDLKVEFSAAKQKVLEMPEPLLGIFPMMGMQKCPELQRTPLERVQLLFFTMKRFRVDNRDGWGGEILPLLAAALVGK